MRKSFVSNILNSATKLVLLIITIALCILTWFGKVDWDSFIVISSMVFTFYFSGTTTNAKQDLSSSSPKDV